MKLLLDIAGVSPNASTPQDQGKTALHVAVINDDADIVELLLSREDVDVNARREFLGTPLFSVSSVKVARLLVEHPKIDLSARTSMGYGALHTIVSKDLSTLEWLIRSAHLPLTVVANNGCTPLHTAATFARPKSMRFLCTVWKEQGLDINTRDSRGRSALKKAYEEGKLENVKILRSFGGVE